MIPLSPNLHPKRSSRVRLLILHSRCCFGSEFALAAGSELLMLDGDEFDAHSRISERTLAWRAGREMLSSKESEQTRRWIVILVLKVEENMLLNIFFIILFLSF